MNHEGSGSDGSSSVAANRRFYDSLWSASYLVPPQRFNTWPLLSGARGCGAGRLEIGPGLRPRLPVAGTHFVDVSRPALSRLKDRGGLTTLGEITALPFPDCIFDLVCAFDIVEHAEDDGQVFRELGRVARDDAAVVSRCRSMPRAGAPSTSSWGTFGTTNPPTSWPLGLCSLVVEQSAGFGMEPRSRWLLDFAVWGLTHRRVQAMRWYNRLFLPLGLLLQKRLACGSG